LQERDALAEYSEKIIHANKEIEDELDSFINVDESITKTIDKRDEKYSPTRS